MFSYFKAALIFTNSVILKGVINTYYYYTRAAVHSAANNDIIIESVSEETAESLKEVAKADVQNFEQHVGTTIMKFETCNNILIDTPLYNMQWIDLPVPVRKAIMPMCPVEIMKYCNKAKPVRDWNESTFLELFGPSVTVGEIQSKKIPFVINKIIDEVPWMRHQAMLRAKTCWVENWLDRGDRQWDSDIMSWSSMWRLHPSPMLIPEPQVVKLKDIQIPQWVDGDTERIKALGLNGANLDSLKDILVKEIESVDFKGPNGKVIKLVKREILAPYPIESELFDETVKKVSNFIADLMAIEGSTSMLFTITKWLFEIWAFSRKYKLSMWEVIRGGKK
jgi:hypothetical protein